MIELYEDQIEFVQKLRGAIKSGYRAILGVASPAFGKTIVAAYIIQEILKREDPSAWFLVHRKNLLAQTTKSFWNLKIQHGIMASGNASTPYPVQVGLIGSVVRRLPQLKAPKVLFVDEAHLSRGNMFETVVLWAISQGSIVIGLTGSPDRLDGKSLGDIFQTMVLSKSPRWLIENGRLADYDAYSLPGTPDLDGLKTTRNGDYREKDLFEIMNKSAIMGDAVEHWKRLANGRRTVAYCVNIRHSIDTAAAFNQAGIPSVHVDKDTTKSELRDACEGLASGRYKVLMNCELVIEGFDLSQQVGRDVPLEAGIFLRPTKSLARWLQMAFRPLRKQKNKAVLLDHAGLIHEHGLPCSDREWELQNKPKSDREKQSLEQAASVRTCSKCYLSFNSREDACPFCGSPVKKNERKIAIIQGELEKVDREAMEEFRKQAAKQARQEQGKARSIEDLVRVGLRRNLNDPSFWAAKIHASRNQSMNFSAALSEARKAHYLILNEVNH